MTCLRPSLSILAALAVPAMVASPAALAQTVFVQAATPDADALANEMRTLAANPGDINAMVRAGELTLKLDDPTAAAGFFARAERIDPSNPRIKAGRGMIAVQAGRPGEALRLFAEAEALRGDVRRFAADRGLAYDLIGEQERAQRDYRLALRDGPADETLRRYALSLGISGKRDEALQVIDPLLRRSDRGAWRTRAFVLAMTGDSKGAERIAASMMPGGLGQGLQPFFARLPTLSPIDRAFAVHFGEVRPTPQRFADARLAPRLPALQPEAGRPVAVLAALTVASQPVKEDRKTRRAREKREKQQKTQIRVASVQAPVPLPQPPAYQAPSTQVASSYSSPSYQAPSYRAPAPQTATTQTPPYTVATATPSYRAPVTAMPSYQSAINQLPAYRPAPARSTVTAASTNPVAPSARRSVDPPRGAAVPETARVAPDRNRAAATTSVAPAVTTSTASPVSDVPVRAVPPATSIAQVVTPTPVVVTAAPTAARVQIANATIPPATPTPAAVTPAPVTTMPAVTSAPAAVVAAAATVPAPVVTTVAPTILPPVPGPARGEDSILAKIIANITVPGSELDVAPVEPEPRPAQPAATPVTPVPAVAAAAPTQSAASAGERAADKLANDKAVAEAERLAAKKLSDAKKAADAKKLADTKKLADAKKLAETKKAEDLKKKNDPKLLEPARIWVQVSGGANEGDLPKEWARLRTKAPLTFKGKAGWTTPLRATNRVLTGPFKTDGEARSFVNALSKEGLSAFTFTSEAGQKVSKLAGK